MQDDVDITQELLSAVLSSYPACGNVQQLNYSDRCNYILHTPECSEAVSFINYLSFLYCSLAPYNTFTMVVDTCVMSSICILIFAIIAITTEKVFCPALQVLSTAFGLSEHLAGVTILAFGNGAADVLGGLIANTAGKKMTLFSDSIGGLLFVIGIVGAAICITNPFQLQAYSVFRDIGFLLFTSAYIDYVITSQDSINIWESIAIISIYIIYLIVIIMDQYMLKHIIKDMETKRITIVSDQSILSELRGEANVELYARTSSRKSQESQLVIIDIEQTRLSKHLHMTPNDGLFRQFIETLNPFHGWKGKTIGSKIAMILQSPIVLTLSIIIPIADYQLERHGWSKLLNCVQIVTMPFFVWLLIEIGFDKPVFLLTDVFYTLPLTVTIAILYFQKTRTDTAPKHHYLLSIYTAVGAMTIIYLCVRETSAMTSSFGVITGCTNAFLGVTLLSWGASVGDLISNIKMAQQGYAKMSYAACLGGPFVNNVLAIGISFFIQCLNSPDHKFQIPANEMVENCLVFILLLLVSTLFATVTTDFYTRRCTAYFSVAIYIIFLLYSLLVEFEVIETYSSKMAQETFNN